MRQARNFDTVGSGKTSRPDEDVYIYLYIIVYTYIYVIILYICIHIYIYIHVICIEWFSVQTGSKAPCFCVWHWVSRSRSVRRSLDVALVQRAAKTGPRSPARWDTTRPHLRITIGISYSYLRIYRDILSITKGISLQWDFMGQVYGIIFMWCIFLGYPIVYSIWIIYNGI